MNTWRARWERRAGAPAVRLGTARTAAGEVTLGAERWAEAFRRAGLVPGDRLVTVLPTGVRLAQVVLAGLWEGLTLAPLPPGTDPTAAVALVDPAAAVAGPRAQGWDGLGWAWLGEGADGPGAPPSHRRGAGPPSPAARLLCEPSGGGPWAALVDDNLEHAVDAVLEALHPDRARWLSVLPWHTPAGLLLDLLPALLRADEIARPATGDDLTLEDVANALQRWQPTHTVLPLAVVRSLRDRWGDLAPLEGLLGGLVSGPGLDAELARDLRRTRLRSHRGAPELSCMVTLGEPGMWRLGALGRPVGCSIHDGPGGDLLVSGRPVAGGRWVQGQLQLVDRGAPVAVAPG